GALHRCVDRRALGGLAAYRRAAFQLGQPEPAAEHGLDVAGLFGALARLVHVALGARKAREVALDIGLRRSPVDAEVLRHAERRHAVDQAEVDDFGHAALIIFYLS